MPPTHPCISVLRGATFDIVCPERHADVKGGGSDNVKNGTSATRAPPSLKPDINQARGGWAGIPKSQIRNFAILHPASRIHRRVGGWLSAFIWVICGFSGGVEGNS